MPLFLQIYLPILGALIALAALPRRKAIWIAVCAGLLTSLVLALAHHGKEHCVTPPDRDQQVEKRVEHRVVVDQVGGVVYLGPEPLAMCEARAEAIRPGSEVHEVRIQKRTVTVDPWEDVADV